VPDLTRGRRLGILAICCTSLLMVALDTTIVNVALPAIQHDLHASVSGLQWTIDAYVLTLASLLMLSGSTGDRLGRLRVFRVGLILFTVGSLACGLAPGLGWLVGFRVVQAVGGSMLNPVALGIITNTITDPRERAQAIGLWGGVAGIAMSLGPIVGGALVGSVGWRAVFWVNVPVGLLALVLTTLYIPESRAERPRRPDAVGQVLVILLLASLTYGIIEGPTAGWGSAVIATCFVVAVVSLVALIAWEQRRDDPLLELRFFRSVPFSGANLIGVFAFSAMSGFLFLNALYLQDVREFSALKSGLCLLPMALLVLVGAPISGRIVATWGPRWPMACAGIGMLAFGLMFVRVTATTSMPYLLTCYGMFGAGFSLVNAPITNSAVSGMPRAQAGVAAAVASTSRQVGAALGVAVIGSVVTSGVHGSLRVGFVQAAHVGWWILAGCALAVSVLGILTTGRWANGTAEQVAVDLRPEERRIPASTS